MASKKIKKLLKAAVAGYAGAKLLGAGAKGSAAANVDSGRAGKSASAVARKVANTKKSVYKDAIMRGGKGAQPGKIGVMDKIKNFMKKEVYIPMDFTKRGPGIKKTDSLAGDYGNAFSDADGMPQGARAGKMIKARGGKLVKLKPTKLY